MDWSDTVRRATALAALNGTITFGQLDALVTRNYEPEDLADLLLALEAEGIRLVEDESNDG